MKIYIVSFLTLLSLTIDAQKLLLQDDFSSNKYGWDESEVCSFVNQQYTINASAEGTQSFINYFIDTKKDFVVSCELKQQSGNDKGLFGMFWSSGDSYYNQFLISSRGEYVVFNGEPAQIKTRKKASVNPKGNSNKLKLEAQSGTWRFYLNDELLETQKPMPVYGSALGFIALAEMRLAVTGFSLLQDQQINLSPDAVKNKKENLGSLINGAEDDLGPIISIDGKTLYLARQNSAGNVGGEQDDEDVWYSTWGGGQWTNTKNLGRAVNTPGADNLLAVSADNNTLVFDIDNQLAVRHRTESGWSAAEKLDLKFENESDHFVASLSADGKAVVFSAMLKDNVAYDPNRNENDLFVFLKQEDGKWSNPVSLGNQINTIGEETSPFLAADGKTFYFASNGRPGFGDQDIFSATRLDDTWTNWSLPVNLGPQVNSVRFDAYYTVPASGEYAYFVSYDQGYGKADIFKIKLTKGNKPLAVTLVKGKVLNKRNNQPLAASIHFENLRTKKDVGEARSDPKTGEFQIVLPFGVNYGVRATKADFYSVHEYLELPAGDQYREVKKNLLMVPIEVGETIKLNNVFFEAGLAVLRPESSPELDRLVQILKENPTINIQLEGHTDNLGTPDVLLKLSEDRVTTVKGYLVERGIAGTRITGKGYGATKPVTQGNTEEERLLNRRVEFVITKK
ncbi:MAG: OmpA family protein [Flammeovirgaceae bacterium]